jgi:hypothetical protein
MFRMKLAAVVCGLAVVGVAQSSSAAEAANSAVPISNSEHWNEYEREAVRIATEFTAAWDVGDAEKAASYVGKNFQYRGDPSENFMRGRDTFYKRLSRAAGTPPAGAAAQAGAPARTATTRPPVGTPGSGSLGKLDITEIYAVGDWYDTVVLMLRVDTSQMGGKEMVMPVATMLRIGKGKIQEWLDAPTIKWDMAPANLTDCAGSMCDE